MVKNQRRWGWWFFVLEAYQSLSSLSLSLSLTLSLQGNPSGLVVHSALPVEPCSSLADAPLLETLLSVSVNLLDATHPPPSLPPSLPARSRVHACCFPLWPPTGVSAEGLRRPVALRPFQLALHRPRVQHGGGLASCRAAAQLPAAAAHPPPAKLCPRPPHLQDRSECSLRQPPASLPPPPPSPTSSPSPPLLDVLVCSPLQCCCAPAGRRCNWCTSYWRTRRRLRPFTPPLRCWALARTKPIPLRSPRTVSRNLCFFLGNRNLD